MVVSSKGSVIKPIEKTALLKTINTAVASKGTTSVSINDKIVVMDRNECLFIKVSDIFYAEAKGAYTKLLVKDRGELMVSKSIKAFSEKLPENYFCRVHKSFLINLIHVDRYIKSDGGYVQMDSGETIPVSTRKKDAFMHIMDEMAI